MSSLINFNITDDLYVGGASAEFDNNREEMVELYLAAVNADNQDPKLGGDLLSGYQIIDLFFQDTCRRTGRDEEIDLFQLHNEGSDSGKLQLYVNLGDRFLRVDIVKREKYSIFAIGTVSDSLDYDRDNLVTMHRSVSIGGIKVFRGMNYRESESFEEFADLLVDVIQLMTPENTYIFNPDAE